MAIGIDSRELLELSIKTISVPDAIKALNPDIEAFWCFGNTTEEQLASLDYTAGGVNLSPNPTNITTQQITDKIAELQALEDAKADTEEANKASANQKLLDLGLSQEEVNAFKRSINTI